MLPFPLKTAICFNYFFSVVIIKRYADNSSPFFQPIFSGASGVKSNLYFLPFKAEQSYTVSRDNSTTDFLELAQEFGSNFDLSAQDGDSTQR